MTNTAVNDADLDCQLIVGSVGAYPLPCCFADATEVVVVGGNVVNDVSEDDVDEVGLSSP